MNTSILSLCLGVIGLCGTCIFLFLAALLFWRNRAYSPGSFRWHMRNQSLKHLSALASLFFLAMAASYGILLEAWALLYLLIGLKAGTWWLRITIAQRV